MVKKLGLNRILREINEVNSQFQNLRTYIVPDPKNRRADLFYFVMYPADGSLADRPIVGKMFLRTGLATYPEYPPIVHVFTKTKRFNVDIFNRGDDSFQESSSMCFDILNKKGSYGEGIWEKDFTLSAVFASLLQVLVEYKVQQQCSNNYEITEAVSMQKMATQHAEIDKVWSKYKSYFADCPKIIRTKAKKIPVHQQIKFPSNELIVSCKKSSRIHSSYPFWLDNADFSVVVDLTDFRNKLTLEKHLYNFVVSIVLSNSPKDPFGRQDSTILVRDGITATAAKKLAGEDMKWFYHGTPLTDFQKIYVTVSQMQITLVVDKEGKKDEDCLVFGDTVLSYLTEAELGTSIEGRPFYLLIYVEAKADLESLTEVEEEQLIKDPICIRLNTETRYGYIHPSKRYQKNTDQPVKPECMSVDCGQMILNTQKHFTYLSNLIAFHDQVVRSKHNKTTMVVDFSKRKLSPEDLLNWTNTHVELEPRLVGYLRLLLNEWELESKKTQKAIVIPQPEPSTTQIDKKEGPKEIRKRAPLTFLSTVNAEPCISPAQFWSALRIDQTKPLPQPIGTPPATLSASNFPTISNESSKTSSFTNFFDLSSSGVGSSIESLVPRVTRVSIYMSRNSILMYHDILGPQNMLHLLNKYDKVITPGHVILCHRNDFNYQDEFDHFLTSSYTEDQIIEFHVKGVAYDQVALVLLIDVEKTKPKIGFKQTKYRRSLVTTIAINGNSPLSYGSSLVDKLEQKTSNLKATMKLFNEPIKCLGQIKFYRK